MQITAELVKDLIAAQFPQWSGLPVRPVEKSGHDNRTFHLGDAMSVRLPSGKAYEAQVQKESRWLPYLQAQLDFPVSAPLAVGQPSAQYPYFWSVNRWIEGCTLLEEPPEDCAALAAALASALKKLQQIDCTGGPEAGAHNFYRGCSPAVYDGGTRAALDALRGRLPTDRLAAVWADCTAAPYTDRGVWVHGDIAPGNILMRDRRFCGLIDFGILGTGDPACDYAMAWTYFEAAERRVFLGGLSCGMIARARGWALWKSLITYDDENPDSRQAARHAVREILGETG